MSKAHWFTGKIIQRELSIVPYVHSSKGTFSNAEAACAVYSYHLLVEGQYEDCADTEKHLVPIVGTASNHPLLPLVRKDDIVTFSRGGDTGFNQMTVHFDKRQPEQA